MARAQNWPVRWTAHACSLQARIHRPTARPILARLRTPIVPPLRVFPQTTLEGHRFARATALPQLVHRVPVEPVVIASRWRAGFHPRSSPTAAASRRSPCAAATSRAPPRSRSVWRAPACWRCRSSALLPETYGPTFGSQKRHDFLRTRRHTPLEAPIPPRPGGGCTRTGGLGLTTARLLLQSSFPRSRRGGRWQAENPNPPSSR
jgi:hypothetical protein